MVWLGPYFRIRYVTRRDNLGVSPERLTTNLLSSFPTILIPSFSKHELLSLHFQTHNFNYEGLVTQRTTTWGRWLLLIQSSAPLHFAPNRHSLSDDYLVASISCSISFLYRSLQRLQYPYLSIHSGRISSRYSDSSRTIRFEKPSHYRHVSSATKYQTSHA